MLEPRFTTSAHPSLFNTLCSTLIQLSMATFVASLAPPALGHTLDQTGRWTPPLTLGGTQVHMALLPGDGHPYHAKVLWWYGEGHHEKIYSGILRWKVGEYNCSYFPGTTLIQPVTLGLPPDSAGLFCSSESHLADAGGRLFLAGGTQPGTEYGVNHAFTFDSATETWTRVDSMGVNAKRWYPTSTALPSGKQLVTSGSKYHQIEFFGGRVSGNALPMDRALWRYGLGGKGVADGAVRQSMTPGQWPTPRDGHSAVYFGITTHIFGGRDSLGTTYFNDYWQLGRADSAFQPDYDFRWLLVPISAKPPARREHTAIAIDHPVTRMIVFGGIKKNPQGQDAVLDDVWRLYWDSFLNSYRWSQVNVTTPLDSAPGPRNGHVAYWHGARKRMLMFGGRATSTGVPADAALWALNFNSDFTTAAWEQLGAMGPSARFDHALTDSASSPTVAFLFGGDLGGGNKANDLWKLNVGDTPTWEAITDLGGDYPSVRSGHTATLLGHLLVVFGGRSDDSTVYLAHVESMNTGELRQWTSYAAHSSALTGHTAIFYGGPFERIPQIFDPAAPSGSRWTSLTGAPHLQDWYPQTFVWKQDTVFVSGPDESSYKLSTNTPKWNKYPDGTSGFRGGSAVMYRPGKVMKCGSRDTDRGLTPEHASVGTTKHIDLSLQASGQWDSSWNEMLPRVNHNLVMLPNGKVLVVGGTGYINNDDTLSAVRKPEIWDPEYNGGQGRWEGLDILAQHQINRDYHSTALLLPDARILLGGGNTDLQGRNAVEIFCPPYLFTSSGSLATRPSIADVPRVLRYGTQFSVCLSASATISTVSLIKPAAVTHGFDQDQRFVQLSFTGPSGTPPRLTVTAPSGPDAAPPGDYLLFLVNGNGVPSVARWLRMVSSEDVAPPDTVRNLTRDLCTQTAVNLMWTASGDDGMTGHASYSDLRYSTSPITSDNFCLATPVFPQPVPGTSGATQQFLVTGMPPCSSLHFSIKFLDEAGNASPFSGSVSANTLCECCQGDARTRSARESGAGVHPGDGDEGSASTAEVGPRVAPTGATLATVGSGLLVEATPGPRGLDVRLFSVADGYEGHAVASDGGVLTQKLDGAGRWTSQLGYELPATNRFALCAQNEPMRWAFLAPCTVTSVLPAVRGEGAAWQLESARNSRLGDVTAALTLADSLPRLGEGDTLAVHYSAVPDTGTQSKGWVLLLDRANPAAPATRAGRSAAPEGRALPTAFALLHNQPNPFAARTTIRFALPVASRVKLEVFDLLGRRVRTLADAAYDAGEHEVTWDRRTTRGALASPGLYFYRMEAGAYRQRIAMMIVP